MATSSIFAKSSFNVDDLVVCHGLKESRTTFAARILDDSKMHRPARDGMVWVRETGLDVDPRQAWVTEWAKDKIA